MRLRDKLLWALVLIVGLVLTYYVVWPIVSFILTWSFYVAFTVFWILALMAVVIHYWMKYATGKSRDLEP